MRSPRASLAFKKLLTVVALGFTLLTPTGAWAQGGTTAIFGDAAIALMFLGDIELEEPLHLSGGLALTCRDASASAAQMNSGNHPSLNMSNQFAKLNFIDDYASNPENAARGLWPFWEFVIEGDAAPLAPSAWTSDDDKRIWADAPAGSQWIFPMLDGDPPERGPETLASIYFGGWYIPTAEDAAKMRLRITYRADDALVAVYLNDLLKKNNLLATPVTRDTSSVGTEPAVVELKGFVQGLNFISLVVHSTRGPNQDANYQGIAAAFDAYCYTPTVTVTKMLAPTKAQGRFTLKINDHATANLGHGGSTAAVPVDAGTQVTVAELADEGTSLDDYTSKLTCTGVDGVTGTTEGSFTMPDSDVQCSFTNTRKPAPATPVPALSEWALMLMGLLAAGLGAGRLRR